MKIAIYKDFYMDYEYVREVSDLNSDIIISEIIEVEITMLSNETVNKKEIAVIDMAITSEMAKSESRLNTLKQRRQELLAIGVSK